MKYRLFITAIIAALFTFGLSSCFYGPYQGRGRGPGGHRPHYYRPYHHGYNHNR